MDKIIKPNLTGTYLKRYVFTFWNDKHLCISVQKYLISNGAESIFNLWPERPETIVLSVLRFTDSDYPFGIFKLF
jgi:hypothetical protein